MTGVRERAEPIAALLPHAGWVSGLPEGAVHASLYSVPEPDRAEAAARFVRAGLPIHLDIIIGVDGAGAPVHVGVMPEQIELIAVEHPGAQLEVHVIVLDAAKDRPDLRAEVARVIARAGSARSAGSTGTAGRARVQRIALPAQFAADLALTEAFRAMGGEIWSVVHPDDECGAHRDLSGAGATSGALVMLIAPGTRQSARADLLDRVAALAPFVHVGVDGGVTAEVAERALASGAQHVVVGRALLGPAPHSERSSAAPQGEAS